MKNRIMLLVLVGLLCAPQLLAKPSSPAPSSTQEERAFVLYQEAGQLFEDDDFASAVRKLEEAYALFPEAIILVKMAEGLEHLGRLQAALDAFKAVNTDDEALSSRVRVAIRRLEVALTKGVPISLDTGGVVGARIFVNGHDTGKVTPAVVELVRGTHHLRIEKPGYQPVERAEFTIEGTEAQSFVFEMPPIEVTLVLELNGARQDRVVVTLDGEPVGLEPDGDAQRWELQITEGEHEVSCAERGTEVTVQTITAVSGQQVTLRCDPPSLSRERELEWAIVGSGSAIAVAGLGMLIWYGVELDYAARTNQRVIQGFPKETIGGVLLGLGAVSALAGGLLLLEGSARSADAGTAGVAVVPLVSMSPSKDWVVGLSGRF